MRVYFRIVNAVQGGAGAAHVERPRLPALARARVHAAARRRSTWSPSAAAGYAVLEGVEAVGLWYQKRWAEYLTFVATLVFMPYEIYELSLSVSAFKIVAFVVNVVIAVYLLFAKRLFGLRRRRRGGGARAGAGRRLGGARADGAGRVGSRARRCSARARARARTRPPPRRSGRAGAGGRRARSGRGSSRRGRGSLDEREARFRAVGHRDRDGAVQLDDRRRRRVAAARRTAAAICAPVASRPRRAATAIAACSWYGPGDRSASARSSARAALPRSRASSQSARS